MLKIPATGTVYIACGEDHCLIADWDEFIGLTSNLGETFDTLQFPSTGYSVSRVQHTKDSSYYLAGMRTDTLQQTVIYKSVNAGQSWEHIFEKPYSPHIFYMHTDSFGFVSTGLGALYRTMNGWQTYDITQYSISTGLTSAYFLNDSVGFVGAKGSALFTADSGNNWVGGYFFNSGTFIGSFSQTNDTTIFATGGPNQHNWAHIYRSNDTGATREIVFESKNKARRIYEIKCFPNGECIAVGWQGIDQTGLVYRTLDNGDTWYEIEVPTDKILYNLEFANDSIAFIGGEDGTLIRMNRNQLPPPDTTEDTTTVIHDVSIRGHDVLIYPNPATNTQQVELNLLESSEVSHKLRSIDGSLIRNRDMGTLKAGKHTLSIELYDMPQGMYFHDIIIGEERIMKRFLHY
ncbi:MAG: T9SS type A sorting domain-containing protein [Salibacteraceae bacterium]